VVDGNVAREFEGLLEAAFDHEESTQGLLGFGERAVRNNRFAFAPSHTFGR
jgi:hypothetical protein